MTNIQDLLPFYALDALTSDERAEVDAWLLEHPKAQVELNEMMQTTEHLDDSFEPIVPSTSVKSSLLARIADDPRTVTAPTPPAATPARNPQSFWEKLGLRQFSPAVAALGLALAVVMFVFGLNQRQQVQLLRNDLAARDAEIALADSEIASQSATLSDRDAQIAELETTAAVIQNEITALQEESSALATANQALEQQLNNLDDGSTEIAALEEAVTAAQEQIAALEADNQLLVQTNQVLQDQIAGDEELLAVFTAPNWQVSPIVGTEFDADARGHLVLNPTSSQAVLSVSNLETLDDALTYQFWLIGDDGPEDAGTFALDHTGDATYIFDLAALDPYSAIGVSIEPLGGSDQPTGAIVMLTSLDS